jgi:phosphatidylserine decarboxylase
MTLRAQILRLLAQEDINFLLTNRIPRRLLTRFMGWFSKVEQPIVRDLSIALWRFFSDLDLSDAKKTTFRSMHDCFVRELKEGARPVDERPGILVSPCDAIIGASGEIAGARVFQVKGLEYTLEDLLRDRDLVEAHRNGRYVTLRLTSSMYHRFHSPHDCHLQQATCISGDTWNVNPIALKRVERLFCKNERAILRTKLVASGHTITLVPVAAILVAGIRLLLHEKPLSLRDGGVHCFPAGVGFAKGQQMGWFEHGSTIIVLAPEGFSLCENVQEDARIRVGQPLMRLPAGVRFKRPA